VKYRLVTAGAILLAWIPIYLLGQENNDLIRLFPLALLALFQIGEKQIRDKFNKFLNFLRK
jgi:hypothetical protein